MDLSGGLVGDALAVRPHVPAVAAYHVIEERSLSALQYPWHPAFWAMASVLGELISVYLALASLS